MSELAGKTAVVTGSTSGIGLAIAGELAAAGAACLIHGRREDSAKMAVKRIRDAGGTADYLLADLASRENIDDLATRAGIGAGASIFG